MSAIIEADIIENPHGDVVQEGMTKTVTVTWTLSTAATYTQSVKFYVVGSLVTIDGGNWLTAAKVGTTVVSAAIPSTLWPSTARTIPIEICTNTNSYVMGTLFISAAGIMSLGADLAQTATAFTVNLNYNLRGSYML
ncbi:MAG: hypothetical protein P4L69_15630 [Desulfosporosinus sp.]|nr:hypothetical protein [Desulfosporosinus sp.]